MKIFICGLSVVLFAMYLLIATLFGCVETSLNPVAIIKADTLIKMDWAKAVLQGKVSGDSVTSLWVYDSSNVEDVYIEQPDSLTTNIELRKQGIYPFVLWAVDKYNLMDSSRVIVIVQ